MNPERNLLRKILTQYRLLMESDGARHNMSMTGGTFTAGMWAGQRLDSLMESAEVLLSEKGTETTR